MLKTDNVDEFIVISGLINYCKSQDECEKCNLYKTCGVLAGEKKLSFVIEGVMFEYEDNEWVSYKNRVSADEEEEDE